MRRTSKRKKAQQVLLNEVKKQLLLQAERWGRTGYYTPVKLEEIELDSCRRIKGDLLAERANLEYELEAIDSSRREIELKLSKLGVYIKRAERVARKHDKNIDKMLEKLVGNRKKTLNALERVKFKTDSLVSILISDN
jgi:hypothetical protein